ncbi:hypothetical protein WG66_012916 [Moniliophthora roreri]|nr:hypothetical protein WG66_012916 [Moniliophthora roreri]
MLMSPVPITESTGREKLSAKMAKIVRIPRHPEIDAVLF